MKKQDVQGLHFVYGTLKDILTGKEILDTDDERFRQKIARLLIEEKGWPSGNITPGKRIETQFAGNFVVSRIDFYIEHEKTPFMIIRYGPGSIVTRERPAIAAARVLLPEMRIPIAVVTNGNDASVLETKKGQKIGSGLESIPSKDEANHLLERFPPEPFPEEKREREYRILNAYDVNVCAMPYRHA